MPRSPRASRSRSRSTTPRRSRSRSAVSRSQSRSRSPSRSPSRSRSRSRTRSRSRSRSGSRPKSDAGKIAAWDDNVEYEDFVAADEESPTFHLKESTVDLVNSKVYKAAPLGKKYYNDLKKTKYMLPRAVHETLEPKPVPAQVVSSVGGMDLNRLHGGLNMLHNISRVSQRPVWAFMELLQRTRGNLKRIGSASFTSPPFLTSNVSPLPDGHVELPYSEEEELRHMALCPQNPTPQEVRDMHRSLGVYKKFHESASAAMVSMMSALSAQQINFGNVKSSLDEMWGRTQDYIHMARFFETHVKEMRRSQLVKAHTKEFVEWLENVHHKDRDRLGARDQSDEILAADYEDVIKQFNEFKKTRNSALKSAHRPKIPVASSSSSNSGYKKDDPGSSGSGFKRDNRGSRVSPRREDNQKQRPPKTNKRSYPRKRGGGGGNSGSKDSEPPAKKQDKGKTR